MDLERVEKLVKLFAGSRADELSIEADGWQVSLRRGIALLTLPASVPVREVRVAIIEEPELTADGPTVAITAPLVGIFREGPSRWKVGDRVRAGAPVGGIESMKILNPVTAEVSGELVEFLVEDGQPVEYGQALLVVKPLPEEPIEEEAEE